MRWLHNHLSYLLIFTLRKWFPGMGQWVEADSGRSYSVGRYLGPDANPAE